MQDEASKGVPILFCFGGTDPSGGAGLPADARAAAVFGAHACGIVTAVVAQNTCGAVLIEPIPAQIVRAQLQTLLQDVQPDAIKTGLLATRAQVEIVAECAERLNIPLVVDTVFAPSSGVRFCDEDTVDVVRELLLPRCALVTPNRSEAEMLCGHALLSESDVRHALCILMKTGAGGVLLKGGHFDGESARDWLMWREAESPGVTHEAELSARRLNCEVRGTGCQLAAGIAAQLAQGVALVTAARAAKMWLWQEMQDAAAIGGGRRVTRGRNRGGHGVEENDES